MFSHLRDDSRVSRFRGLNSWVLHLAEADLEGRDRVDIIRRRLNPIAEPNPLASNVLETIFEEPPWSLSGRGIDG